MLRRALPLIVLSTFCSLAPAQDKSRYNLFDPTPREAMREISTDRPDVTESPYTVDAGHFQVEMSLIEYVYDDDDDTQINEFSFAPSNLKVGLLNNVDVQFVLDPYVYQRVHTPAGESTNDGFGTAQARLKVNVWGNDGGDTALAVMPFVQFPTARNDLGGTDHMEGGLIIPFT